MDSEIKDYLPKFDEKQRILPKQPFCASCKKRLNCEKLKLKQLENQTTNKYAEVFIAMYYTCDDFDPIYIQFPITVNEITNDLAFDSFNREKHVGEWCVVVLNAEGYDEEMHVGVYLGELPLTVHALYDKKNNTITNRFHNSPAILLPVFHKVFYGYNMRWKFINEEDDFKNLSQKDTKDYQDYIEIAKKQLTKSEK